MKEFAKGLNELNKKWQLELATCAEVVDLSNFGVVNNSCIDYELIKHLFYNDKELMSFLGYELG